MHPEAEQGYNKSSSSREKVDRGIESLFAEIYETLKNLVNRVRGIEEAVGLMDLEEFNLGKFIVIVSNDDHHPYEVYMINGKKLGMVDAFDNVTDAVSRKNELERGK